MSGLKPVLFAIAFLSGVTSYAAEDTDCAQKLKPAAGSLNESLNSLPPLPLDYPSVREGIENLLKNLVPLHPHIQNLDNVIRDLADKRILPEVAREILEMLKEGIQKEAAAALSRYEIGDGSVRALLEGYKILLRKLEAARLAADSLERELIAQNQNVEDETTESQKTWDANTSEHDEKDSSQNGRTEALKNELAEEELTHSLRKEIENREADESEAEGPYSDALNLNQISDEELRELLEEAAENYQKNKADEDFKPTTDEQKELERQLRERLERLKEKKSSVESSRGQVREQIEESARNDLQKKKEAYQQQKAAQQKAQEQRPQDIDRSEQNAEQKSGQTQGTQEQDSQERNSQQQSAQGQAGEQQNSDSGANQQQGLEHQQDEGQQTGEGEQPGQGEQQGQSQQSGQGPQGQQQSEGNQKGQGQQQGQGQRQGEGQQQGQGQQQGEGGRQAGQEQQQGQQQGEGQRQGEGGRRSIGQQQNDSSNEEGGRGQGQREVSESSENAKQSAGSGASKGGATAQQSLTDDLADLLANLDVNEMLRKAAEAREQSSTDQPQNSRFEFGDNPSRDRNPAPSLQLSDLSPRESDKPNPSRPRLTPRARERRPQVEQGQQLELTEQQEASLFQIYLKHVWRQILEKYSSAEPLFSAINQYMTIANKWGEQKGFVWARQEATSALDFYHELQGTGVQYKELSELALSFIGSMDASSSDKLFQRIHFLHSLLKEKNGKSSLNQAEQKLFEMLSKVLSEVAEKSPTDEEFVATFLAQLMGPLSMNAIIAEYGNATGLNIVRLANDIRSGKLKDLLLYPKLEPYLNILLNTQEVPSSYHSYDGPEVPINEAEFDLVQASEIDEMPRFYRDGAPIGFDIYRLLSGDLLRVLYKDEIEKFDPRKPKPKKVSVVLVDVSGSMKEKNKYLLRNALMNAYLDNAQKDVLVEGGQHAVYFILFDSKPHAPTRLGSFDEAQNYFNNMRENPISNEGGTSITAAIVRAFEMIVEEGREGGSELDAANILLITDAEDAVDFDIVKEARDKVPQDTRIKFNALTLGEYNPHITQLVEMQSKAGQGSIGEVYHQHIPYRELNKLLSDDYLGQLAKTAAFSHQRANFARTDLNSIGRAISRVSSLHLNQQMEGTLKIRAVIGELEMLIPASPEAGHRFLEPLIRDTLNKALSQTWTSGERASYFDMLIDEWAASLSVHRHKVLQGLGSETLQAVKDWISN